MGRTAKPRRAYRPRPVTADTVETAIARAGLLPESSRQALRAPIIAALDGLRTGTGQWPAWCSMADALNVAEQLAADGIASNHAGTIAAAQSVLADLHARLAKGAPWTLRAAELKTLQDAAEIAEIQLEYASQGEVADAIESVKRRVAGALAGSVGADTTVCIGGLGRDRTTVDTTVETNAEAAA